MCLRRLSAHGTLLLCLALAILGVALRPPAPADAAMLKGLQDMRMVKSEDGTLRKQFWTSVKRAKVTRVRYLVTWDGESTEIAPDVEEQVRRAAREGREAGARLFVGIYGAINRDRDEQVHVTNAMIKRFSKFTASMGTAFKDLPLAGYLTWNEPNFRSMWPKKQPRTWVKMSNAAYASFKRTDRGTPVIVGEPAPNARTSDAVDPGRFFRLALCLNSKYQSLKNTKSCRTPLRGDAFAIHVHDFKLGPTRTRKNQDAWTIGNLKAARKQINALARAKRISKAAARNVHITEFAYRTSGDFRTPDKTAARYLRQAWNLAKREHIRSFTWYQLQDPGPDNGWRSGLLTSAGRELATWKTFRSLR